MRFCKVLLRVLAASLLICSVTGLIAHAAERGEPLCIPEEQIAAWESGSVSRDASQKNNSCSWQSWYTNVTYYWKCPDAYGDSIFAMRFTATQCQRLDSVKFWVYDAPDDSFGFLDAYVMVYDDDGSGLPGTQLAQVTVPAGSYYAYPTESYADFSPFNLIFNGDFHIGLSVNATSPLSGNECLAFLSDDGSAGTNRSTEWWAGTWGTMLNDWGIDVNFLIEVRLCDLGGPSMEPIVEPEGRYYQTAPTFANFGFDADNGLDDGWYQMDSYTGAWIPLFTDVAGTSWDDDGWSIPGFDLLSDYLHTIYFKASDDSGCVAGESGEWSWQFYKGELQLVPFYPPVAGIILILLVVVSTIIYLRRKKATTIS